MNGFTIPNFIIRLDQYWASIQKHCLKHLAAPPYNIYRHRALRRVADHEIFHYRNVLEDERALLGAVAAHAQIRLEVGAAQLEVEYTDVRIVAANAVDLVLGAEEAIAVRLFRVSAFILFSSLSVFCVAQEAELQLTRQQWLEDLDVMVDTLRARHLELDYRISSEDFAALVSQARRKIYSATCDEEAYVALRQVVCAIEDGHTKLGDAGILDFDLYFPIRLYSFRDGVFIIAIEEHHADSIGARVVGFGNVDIDKALELAGTVTAADNEFSRLHNAAKNLANARLLRGLNIIESLDSLTMRVVTGENQEKELTLSSFKRETSDRWWERQDVGPEGATYVNAFSAGRAELPLYLKHLGQDHRKYWFEFLRPHNTLFMQFNVTQHEGRFDLFPLQREPETFYQFTTRIFEFADAHRDQIDKFVIDIRFNGGGDGWIVRPFVREIIKRDWINQTGRLFVLTGRKTYSAAVIMMADMDLYTNVLFVGEPPGCAFNLFSHPQDAATLPNSGYQLVISTERYFCSRPLTTDYYFSPDVPVVFSSEDYFSGADPVLEAVLRGGAKTAKMVLDEEGISATEAFIKQQQQGCADLHWWTDEAYEGLEGAINTYGYNVMGGGDLVEAIAAFELNTRLFPDSWNAWDSLAEGHVKTGNRELAIEYYKRSLVLNPANNNAMQMLRKLEDSQDPESP